MGFFNLKDPPPNDANRRIRDVEGGAPIGYSSVTRGGLRIASEEGLTVEGSILGLANNELGKPAHIEWGGTANFTGDVTATQFEVADGDFRATMNRSGFEVDAVGFDIPTGQSHPFRFHLGSAGVSMEFRDETAQITPLGLKIGALPTTSAPNSMSTVLVDQNGVFHRGPMFGGIGGPGSGSGAGMRLKPEPITSYTGLHWQGHTTTYGPRQCEHAYRIIEACLAIPGITRDMIVATLMCALVESVLWMYANSNVPSSFNYPHDMVGSDHESVGLFQQQPWWGPIGQLMSYGYSVRAFIGGTSGPNAGTPAGLLDISPPWDQRATLGTAVQAVQVSAHPGRYDMVRSTAEGMLDAMTETASFVFPFAESTVSDEYGMRWHPIWQEYRMHNGIDLAPGHGSPIRTIGAGVVDGRGTNAGASFGYWVSVQHEGGVQSLYAHMSQPSHWLVGNSVGPDTVIGYVGSTGDSTGAHLHLETRIDGGLVNPRDICQWP